MIIKTDWKGSDALTADEMNRIEGNILQNSHISGSKYATIVIGTSQSGYTEKDVDFLCDGTDDHVEINQAISDMAYGGTLVLLEGIYNLGDRINVWRGIKIQGTPNTVLVRGFTKGSENGIIQINSTSATVSTLRLKGEKSSYSANTNHGIHADVLSADIIRIRDVMCENNGGSGIYVKGGTDHCIENAYTKENGKHGFEILNCGGFFTGCVTITNGGNGMHLSGAYGVKITGCRFSSNTNNGIQLANGTNRCFIMGTSANGNTNGVSALSGAKENILNGCEFSMNNTGVSFASGANSNILTSNVITFATTAISDNGASNVKANNITQL